MYWDKQAYVQYALAGDRLYVGSKPSVYNDFLFFEVKSVIVLALNNVLFTIFSALTLIQKRQLMPSLPLSLGLKVMQFYY